MVSMHNISMVVQLKVTLSSSAIPHQLLAKIDQVLSLAHTHNLPTVTPTQVLNHLDLAYNYDRLVPRTPSMDRYGLAFKSYLDSLVEGEEEEDRMREELKKCEQLSGRHQNVRSCHNLFTNCDNLFTS